MAEGSYNFDMQTPANSHLFESKLCQLYQNLWANDESNKVFDMNSHQSLPTPFYMENKERLLSTSTFKEVSEVRASFEADVTTKKTSEINVPYEVILVSFFGSDQIIETRNEKFIETLPKSTYAC